jgi:hypothetical protein
VPIEEEEEYVHEEVKVRLDSENGCHSSLQSLSSSRLLSKIMKMDSAEK